MKKLLSCLFALIISVSMLAGCNLIEINKSKFYNQVVTEIVYADKTPTKKFTMEDLRQAYLSYGYQFVQNGASAEEALRQTAELMVQRYMLVEEIKTKITLTDNEKNTLKKQTYENINSQLSELESEIRVEWDKVFTSPSATDEASTSLRVSYEEYEPTIEIAYDENGLNPYLKRVDPEEDEIVEDPGEFVQEITDKDVSEEAMKRFKNQLKENNENLGKKIKDADLIKEEINRIYKILEENKYISKYQEVLLQNSEINAQAAVDSYIEKYKRDYEKFANNKSAYHNQMKEDASAVYYHPNSGNEYMWVTHILFKFSDEQTAKLEQLKTDLESNTIEKDYYDEQVEIITSMENTPVQYVNNKGEVVKTNVVAAFADVEHGVNSYDPDFNFTLRVQAFNDYIYKYNDDEGIMNKDFAYVSNLDTSVEDIMVKEFADEARDLFNKDKKRGSECKGSMSVTPVKTQFGYHVVLNLGPVKNIVEYRNINNLTWNALYNVKTQPSSNKTLLHYEYDALKLDSNTVSTYMNGLLADLTASAKKLNYYEYRMFKLIDQLS